MSTTGAISSLPMKTLSWQVIKGAFKINAPFLIIKNAIGIAKGDNIASNLIRLLSSLGGIGGSVALNLFNSSFYAYFAETITALLGGVTLPPVLIAVLVYGLTGLLGGTAGQILSKVAIGMTMLIKHGYSNPALYSNRENVIAELIENGTLTNEEGEGAKYLLETLPHLVQGFEKGTDDRREMKKALLEVKAGNLANAHQIVVDQAHQMNKKLERAQIRAASTPISDEVDPPFLSRTFSPRYRAQRESFKEQHAANLNTVAEKMQRLRPTIRG